MKWTKFVLQVGLQREFKVFLGHVLMKGGLENKCCKTHTAAAKAEETTLNSRLYDKRH